MFESAIGAMMLATLFAAAPALAQDAPGDAGGGPLTPGTAVTEPLDTAHLLVHLDLVGWGLAYATDEAFTSLTVAVVAMVRTRLDEPFERVPVGSALTVVRPEPSERAAIALLLDEGGPAPQLTLRVHTDTSQGEVRLPAPLQPGTGAGIVRRPYLEGIVVPTDPDGRFLLMEAYPDAADGIVSTGDTNDMLAYLAVEVRAE